MFKVNPCSINDLVALKAAGTPVTLTSHPGNASRYKLTLWHCGIPEHLWDITCCVADANNWPMFRLRDGNAELLIDDELHRLIQARTDSNRRFVTAYQMTKDGRRLGRAHVAVCQRLFPEVISSCSRLILQEIEKTKEVFYFLAETRRHEVFSRRITSDGMMIPVTRDVTSSDEIVESFVNVLRELNHLLFSDEPIETHGGFCYSGVAVPLATMLVQYWQTGRNDRYDISGPDMINYASSKEHQDSLTSMLEHLHRWNPKLVPKTIVTRMFPGTVATVGHVPGHVSAEVMGRKVCALRRCSQMSSEGKRRLWHEARNDQQLWPIFIKPSSDHYFSQHDLLAVGGRFAVDEFWKDIPLENMRDILVQADNRLRIK